MTPATPFKPAFTASRQASQRPPSPWAAHRVSLRLAALTLGAAAALLAPNVRAQAQEPAVAMPGPAASQAAAVADTGVPPAVAASAAAPSLAAKPKYAAKDIERAFAYMDANKDGKISREEAAGFRKVAKYFTEADTNQDNMLSLAEFTRAMNGERPAAPAH